MAAARSSFLEKGKQMMGRSKGWFYLGAVALATVAVAPVAAQKPTKVNGVIAGRSGANMMVRTATGTTTVTLNDATKVEEKKGALKLKHSSMAVTSLTPGLKVEVDGTPGPNNTVIATSVKFSAGDLETANEIAGGVNPTAQQAAANQKAVDSNKQAITKNAQGVAANKAGEDSLNARMNNMGSYDVKATATVYFANGSTVIDAKGKSDLQALAAKTKGINGYMVQVAGYASSTGNAAINDKLTDERAQNVIEYLEQTGNVPLYRVLAPAAMGSSHPAATNATVEGQAENRRVVVTIVVNKGVAGN
jgi:outer membrane protein OmpA-like peptidoglycan-associated protein